MALTTGARLGVYEVTARIGEGGMGQVYRARDTKLNRDVALKVLPDAFAGDPERLARFTREAQTLASLNHPNIAHIHGLEESDGVRALVMELVEGDDLSQLIARHASPEAESLRSRPRDGGGVPRGLAIDEALPIAKQIAEALEAAHEQGIIHRDLKPANIRLKLRGAPPPRPEDGRLERRLSAADVADCTVKVLDFGLAKAMEPAAGSSPSLSMSPTITTPAMTQAGMILGTAAYMSPEQARGRTVDKRADIWAFGCVLYEMLTGQRAFGGDDVQETFVAILRDEPDWARLPANLSPTLSTYLRRCLHKDPKQRIHDIADVRLALEGAFETSVSQAVASVAVPPPAVWRRALPVAAALAIGVLATATTWYLTRPAAPPVTRTTIATTGAAALSLNGVDRDIALTPDGRRVVYAGANGTQLFVRALDALASTAIATGGNLRAPFVSPDGQWVGYTDAGGSTLRKVALTGGPPILLAGLDGPMRGATWAPDGTVIFATDNGATGLQRVSAAGGGTPEVLTRPDRAAGDTDHLWPELLPGGDAVLFTITGAGGADAAQIAVRDLATGAQTILVRGGSHAHYVRSGHLIYAAAGTLRAIPFDLSRRETRGTAVPVVPQVATVPQGGANLAVAADGTLVYVDAPGGGAQRTLVWVDRAGKEEPVAAPPRAYRHPRVAPDGRRLAVESLDEQQDLWIWDVARATLARLTAEPGIDRFPLWTPNGRRIVFASSRGGGPLNLWWQAADGTGAAERLATSSNVQNPTAITRDGRQLVFYEVTPTGQRDPRRLALDGSGAVTPLFETPANERNGTLSPDGRWLAYESDSSGRSEVYVRPFPETASGLWQVSADGGAQPVFGPDGAELFFLAPDGALMRVPVETRGPTWSAGTPVRLLAGGYQQAGALRNYDIAPDGQRFLMIKAEGGDGAAALPPSLVLVQHFDEELTRLVPVN